MSRVNFVAIALSCSVVACSPAPESASSGASDRVIQTANQDVARPVVTADKIMRDVVGRVIKITHVSGNNPPVDWTFEADEFKQVEILEREDKLETAAVTVFMTTRNNPGPDEDAVQVSGKLRLHYQRKGSEWVLMMIDNLTFHYTIGIST